MPELEQSSVDCVVDVGLLDKLVTTRVRCISHFALPTEEGNPRSVWLIFRHRYAVQNYL